MNKSIIVGAVILLVGGGAFATMSVADNKIEALYDQNNLGPIHNITSNQSDLGFTGGSVDWTAELVFDPCDPSLNLPIKGTDTIRKGVTGYTIVSQIKPNVDGEDAEAQTIVDNLSALQATTHVNWFGGGNSDLILPADAVSGEDTTLSWEEMTGALSFDKKGDKVIIEDLEVSIPSTSFGHDSMAAQLTNVSYVSDAPMGNVLESGVSKLDVGEFTLSDNTLGRISLHDIAVSVGQEVNADTVDVSLLYEIGSIRGATSGEDIVIDDSTAHIDFKGISRPAVESMMDIFQKASQQCVPQQQLSKEVEAPMLEALKAGMQVESLNNHIKIGDGSITADANMSIPAHPYSSLQDAIQTLPSKASYDATVTFDKAFVKGVSELGGDSNPLLSSSVEDNWQTIIAMTNAEVSGDKATIHTQSASLE